jgi:tetratricopeptide (TPR) repeat protein
MHRRKTFWTIAALSAATALLAALALLARMSPAAPIAAEYPNAPFARVPKDYPRVMPVREMPAAKDEKAVEQYRAERKAVRKYLREEGAIRRAEPEEREAIRAAYDGDYIRGRELASKVLKTTPDSVPALYALALAQLHAEGNLPRALFLIRKVRHILEARGRQNADDSDSREWYLLALDDEHDILAEMDRSAEALRATELLEQIYEPLPWYKPWLLFKLRRFAEADACIKQTEASGRWPEKALNDRLALEEQLQHRSAVYELGCRVTALVSDSPVHWKNHGGGCLNDLRLEEAEKALVKATQCGRPNYWGTPYNDLAYLYVQECRFPEAIDALKHAQVHRAARQPSTLQNDQATFERALALLLLALGRVQDAEPIAKRSHERPNRTGFHTADATDEAFSTSYILAAILDTRIEQMRETEAALSGRERLLEQGKRMELEMEAWALTRRVLKRVAAGDRPNILRPNMPGTSTPETWLAGSIVRMLPPGVAVELIRQARKEEDHPLASPYFDAFEAEAALAGGRPDEALRLAKQALAALPAVGERALRARAAAIGGEAARQIGRQSEWRSLAEQVVADLPNMLRLTRTAVPARIEDDGSPTARLLAQILQASPRLRADSGGFAISIKSAAGRLSFTMFRLTRARHFDDSVPAGGTPEQTAAAAFVKFHERLMAPAIDLTQLDINSLDGSPTALASRAGVDRLLDALRTKPK